MSNPKYCFSKKVKFSFHNVVVVSINFNRFLKASRKVSSKGYGLIKKVLELVFLQFSRATVQMLVLAFQASKVKQIYNVLL